MQWRAEEDREVQAKAAKAVEVVRCGKGPPESGRSRGLEPTGQVHPERGAGDETGEQS